MKTQFEYYALHYLNHWLGIEREIHQNLQSNRKKKKLNALSTGGAHFKVARTLPTKFEKQNSTKRYEPVLQAIETTSLKNCSLSTVPKKVEKVHERLSKFYGNRTVLSATTKFLWLKHRAPVVILDSQAKSSLEIKGNNYEEFFTAWIKEYSDLENKIVNACQKLPRVSKFALDSTAEIEEISKQGWFHQRVFDNYLWHNG
jgi:hypothetical protein